MAGCALITVLEDEPEVHPLALVTLNVYVLFAVRPVNVAVAPVPVNVELLVPSDAVTVQLPVAGNPLNATLAVATLQVGWVIVPIDGAEGVDG